jgi:hypothetical protein
MALDIIDRENILEDIVTTLQGIDTRNDYYMDVRNSSVTRILKPYREVTESDLPMLIISDGSESFNYETMGKRVTNFFSVIIRGIVEDQQNPSQELNKLIADVKKALLVDLRRGIDSSSQPNASNTKLIRIDTDEGLAFPRAVFEMEILIEYHTLDTTR